ncbi:MAG: DegT/DnrJ/EryC1/StrS family aminotransferase [Clostridia bacterium]|nr:DegT/DnrJ/EryC1/StrS family aminotransferase [Clostridia bacterium]
MTIPSNTLLPLFQMHQAEYEQKALDVLRSGFYVLGKEVEAFEREFAAYCGVAHCTSVGTGLDAIRIALHLLGVGEGDEVIVQGNTFIAGVMAITAAGASPVFAEPDAHFALSADELEKRLSPHTKAVLVTHLYGMMTPMDPIVAFCERHGLLLVEDCAQSHGAEYKGKRAGSFGNAGCFSFYPTKNLGCFGDGGAIVTNDASLDEKIRVFRNYGSEKKYYNSVVGTNSRLDELQAGLLRVRLAHMDELNEEKNRIARRYSDGIRNAKLILPVPQPDTYNVWHQYVVRCEERDALAAYLKENGVGTMIHYPVPPHLSGAYSVLGLVPGSLPVTEKYARTVLSLPSYVGLTEEELDCIIGLLNRF